MKRWVWAVVLPIGVACCLWLTGSLLDPHFRVGISLDVQAPPEAVYAVLSSVENYPSWRGDVRRVDADPRNPGKIWLEHYSDGGETEFTSDGGNPPDKWVARVRWSDMSLAGTRIFLCVPMGNGSTRIVATEEGTIDHPLARLKYRFISGHAENLHACLLDLRRRLAD